MRVLMVLLLIFVVSACATPVSSKSADIKLLGTAAERGDKNAFETLLLEAKRGVPEAQFQMGLYDFGHQVSEDANAPGGHGNQPNPVQLHDMEEAAEWWHKAAEQGNPSAQFNLGYFYGFTPYAHDKLSKTEAHVEAVKWLRKAAEQGDRDAGYRLWYIYFMDTVNESAAHRINPHAISGEEGMKWLRRAAEQGHGESEFWLSSYSASDKRQSGQPDYEEAYFWLKLCARNEPKLCKDQDLQKMREKIIQHLSEKRIAAAEKRAAEWKPAPFLPMENKAPDFPPLETQN